jgi:hypothetical protein
VCIVTPSLNQAEFIEETIRSVLTQDYPNIAYMVVDGGSRDGTLDILRRHEGELRWTSGEDDGQSDAINRGFAAGSGEIIAWLNADDRYTPGAFRAAVEAFVQEPSLDLVYGQAVFIDRAGRSLGAARHGEPWNLRELVHGTNFVQQPAAFFRRTAFEAVGGLDVDLHYVMDYDLWIRLGSRGTVRFMPQVLAEVRMYAETKTATGGLPRFEEMERMIRRYGRRSVPSGFEPEMLRALVQACAVSVRRGNVGQTLRHLRHLAPYSCRAVRRHTVRRLRRVGGGNAKSSR